MYPSLQCKSKKILYAFNNSLLASRKVYNCSLDNNLRVMKMTERRDSRCWILYFGILMKINFICINHVRTRYLLTSVNMLYATEGYFRKDTKWKVMGYDLLQFCFYAQMFIRRPFYIVCNDNNELLKTQKIPIDSPCNYWYPRSCWKF